MADTATEEPLTGDDLMETWQFMKAVIQFKDGTMEWDEAIDHMSFYTGLDILLCELMLKELIKEKRHHLMVAFPTLNRLPGPWEGYLSRSERRARGVCRGSSPPTAGP